MWGLHLDFIPDPIVVHIHSPMCQYMLKQWGDALAPTRFLLKQSIIISPKNINTIPFPATVTGWLIGIKISKLTKAFENFFAYAQNK